jgi:hypothetical protein
MHVIVVLCTKFMTLDAVVTEHFGSSSNASDLYFEVRG